MKCMHKTPSLRMALLSSVAAGLALLLPLSGLAHAASARPSSLPEVSEKSIPELQAEQTAGQATSRSLVLAYLARINAYDQNGPALNAIVTLNPKALEEADALDRERRISGPRGPLHGIPVLIKDNYDTVDMPTTGGSLALATLQANADAYQVKRLRDAGAVILGKTTMHELAAGIITVSSLTGYTRNPYEPARTPGGSSGGTAAAVAASFAAAGMGSDICGSIRIPSAFQNLVGLRTTRGLASRSGVMPLSSTQDVAGPLARTVPDLAIMLDATVGPDPLDASTVDAAKHVPKSYRDTLRPDALKGARLGIVRALFGTAPEDGEINAVVDKALNTMRAQGAEIVEIAIPQLDDLLRDSSIIPYEFKYDLAEYLGRHSGAPAQSLTEILEHGMQQAFLDAGLRARNGMDLSNPKDSEALAKVKQKRAALLQLMTDTLANRHVDAFVYPTIQRKAALVGETQYGFANCQLSATTGMPALALPAGFTPDGLPVGLELLGAPYAEPTLLSIAYGWEQQVSPRRAPFSTPPLVNGRAPLPRPLETVSIGNDGPSARVNFVYDAVTGRLSYRAIVSKVDAADVIGVTLQRGDADHPGPVIFNLIRQHQRAARAALTLHGSDREALEAGTLFVHFYTKSAPLGVGREALHLLPASGLN